MENIDIRNYIIENFKDDNIEKIRDSIETTINTRDEDALIGLGVLFELLWNKLSQEEKNQSLENIRQSIKDLAINS
jgi:small acid-soluble spore protein I (minor)